MASYKECSPEEVPASIRFDVPARFAGQIVEIAYGTKFRTEAAAGDPWKRETDTSRPVGDPLRVRYYRRTGK